MKEIKICSVCGKEFTRFAKWGSQCKPCRRAVNKRWEDGNRKKRNEYQRGYWSRNKVKCREATKHWKKINPDRAQVIQKKCYEKNKNKRFSYQYQLYRNDPKYQLKCKIFCAINKSLHGNKNGHHWEDLVGYNVLQLKNHLEKQFIDGMNWNNYGKKGWVVDHIFPISAFNFRSIDDIDFKRCWALDNLRPLWYMENQKKHAKILKPFQPSLLMNARG